MNGILVINKPSGYTSRDVVNKVSKILNIKRVGHTGTLDPMATGVLVLCIGKCSKLCELIVSNDKEYEAGVLVGVEYDTLDISGNLINKDNNININKDSVVSVLKEYTGNIIQEVPLYSAVKVNGKRLYHYARNNEDVVLPKREVNIYSLDLISDVIDNEFKIKCVVSKGTYIRSLIRDIGVSLGSCASMKSLVRTRQGIFKISDSYTLEDISNGNYKLLNPVDVLDINKVYVDSDMEFKIRNGQVLDKFFDGDMAMIIDKDNNLLAIYKNVLDKAKPYKML